MSYSMFILNTYYIYNIIYIYYNIYINILYISYCVVVSRIATLRGGDLQRWRSQSFQSRSGRRTPTPCNGERVIQFSEVNASHAQSLATRTTRCLCCRPSVTTSCLIHCDSTDSSTFLFRFWKAMLSTEGPGSGQIEDFKDILDHWIRAIQHNAQNGHIDLSRSGTQRPVRIDSHKLAAKTCQCLGLGSWDAAGDSPLHHHCDRGQRECMQSFILKRNIFLYSQQFCQIPFLHGRNWRWIRTTYWQTHTDVETSSRLLYTASLHAFAGALLYLSTFDIVWHCFAFVWFVWLMSLFGSFCLALFFRGPSPRHWCLSQSHLPTLNQLKTVLLCLVPLHMPWISHPAFPTPMFWCPSHQHSLPCLHASCFK